MSLAVFQPTPSAATFDDPKFASADPESQRVAATVSGGRVASVP